MKSWINNERGYTLFLAVLIGVLFAIMATLLLSFTLNGIAKDDYRETDLQATELADMGLTRIANEITVELQEKIDEKVSEKNGEGLDPDKDYIPILKETLNKYDCSENGNIIQKDTGDYQVCIDSYTDIENSEYRKLVTFKSIGEVDGKQKEIYSHVEIGAETVPDPLNYAVSTNKDCDKDEECDGEGNLFLHGGAKIIGDLKVDGNIITSNNGSEYILEQVNTLIGSLNNLLTSLLNAVNSLIPDELELQGLLGGILNGLLGWILNPLIDFLLDALHSILDIVINLLNGLLVNLEDLILSLLGIEKEVKDNKWEESDNPSIIPLNDSKKNAELVLGGSVYKLRSNLPDYNEHINQNDFTNNSNYKEITDLEEVFKVAPELANRSPYYDKVVIEDEKENFRPGSLMGFKEATKIYFNEGEKYQNDQIFAPDKQCYRLLDLLQGSWLLDIIRSLVSFLLNLQTCYDVDNYIFHGDNTFDKFVTDRNLNIIRGAIKTKNGLYVGGDLIIGDMDDKNPSNKNKIQVDGPIYVQGDLYISGANAEFNSLIYVEGDVNILNSTINGIKSKGKESMLIVFADGSINMIDNSFFGNYPNDIRGYFYSNENIEIAVKSPMTINGGISGRRVIINSTADAQFQVQYEPEIIEKYSELKQTDTLIYNVDPPILIDRFYEQPDS